MVGRHGIEMFTSLEQEGNALKDPTIKPSIAVLIIRWIAGVWSIASMGFVLLIVVGELIYSRAPAPE
jgi:hypothetical protein